MGDSYKAEQVAGPMGPNASSHNNTINQYRFNAGGGPSIDLGELARELEQLRTALRRANNDDDDPGRDIAIAQIAQAQIAAQNGDEESTFKHLRQVAVGC